MKIKLKRVTLVAIRKASKACNMTTVNDINQELKFQGYGRATAALRDKALGLPKKAGKGLKTIKNQVPAKKRSHKATGKPQGGARKGSGRKLGAATKKTRAIADKLVEDGEQTPLEFMLETMRETPDELRKMHKSGEIDTAEFVVRIQDQIARRYTAAKDAAPYIHPRLASIEAKVEDATHEKWLKLMDEYGL